MSSFNELIPLNQIEVNPSDLLSIKRHDLVPLLTDSSKLNLYAEHIVQAQNALLVGIDPTLNKKLSETISDIIQKLNQSKKKLKQKKFNALQKWLGLDLEFGAGQISYIRDLDRLILDADQLSQRIHIEIQKSSSRFQQAVGLREQMACYIQAARQFLTEYPDFSHHRHPLDNFEERLAKKIQTLESVQANNDISLMQMQLTQQLSLTLTDRFREAQQVLIPAWQYHLEQTQIKNGAVDIEKLDQSREQLIRSLKKSLIKE